MLQTAVGGKARLRIEVRFLKCFTPFPLEVLLPNYLRLAAWNLGSFTHRMVEAG